MAVDDLDKFCRSCGHGTYDSIDYHTYYRSCIKYDMKDTDIVFLQGIGKKVDLIYKKLFPPSVEEFREDNVEKSPEIGVEKSPEIRVEKSPEIRVEKSPEIGVEKSPEIGVEKHFELLDIENIRTCSEDEFLTSGDIEQSRRELEDYIKNCNSPEIEIEKSPEIEVEISRKKDEMYVPKEANDKLNMLLQEDNGQGHGVQFLINIKEKSKKVGDNVDNNKSDNKPSVNNGTMAIIPREDVVRTRGKGKKKGRRYKMYAAAVDPFIQDILNDIKYSKDGMIRVRSSDMAKKMGERFVDKKPITIYSGLKYTLFDYNIAVEMGSLKAIDPVTKKNIKILKMRMKSTDDVLPPSILGIRRGA